MLNIFRLCRNNKLSILCRRVSGNSAVTYTKSATKTGRDLSWKCSRFLALVGVRSGVCGGIGVGVAFGLKNRSATCEAPKHTRFDGVTVQESDPEFDWLTFLEILKPYLKELLAAIVAALACAALSIHIPRVLGDIINVVATHTGSVVTDAARPFLEEIKKPAMRMLGLYGLLSGATFLYIHLLTLVGEGVAHSMKVRLFTSIIREDIAFFDAHRTGELVNRLTVDVNDFKSAFKMVVSQGLRNVAQVLGCTVTLVTISPQMTGLMLVAVPSVILTATLIGTLLRKLSFEAKMQGARLTLLADEALSNMRTVRAFAMENLETQMFTDQSELTKQLNERLGIGIAAFQAGTSLFLNGMVLSTILVGGRLLSQQEMTPGDLMAYLVALQMLQRSFTQLSLLFGTYIKGLHAGARVFEISKVKPAMSLFEGDIIPHHSLIPDVEFRDVTFRYPSRRGGRPVLDGFSLRVPAGQTVALVGPSGSGKSTVAWLLERLYDPEKGSVLLSGQDLKQLNPSWLRGNVLALISQEPVLFATTVKENIRYGRPDATDAQVEEAARLANADEFIRQFPLGYDTVVGERGVAVSGGQKQRIAIARALLKDPAVLILDEATSALDSESEQLVQAALDRVMKNRTTVVIAHRLSTIQNADLIVVLSNGAIVEMGTHKNLMAQKGVYASFVQQQRLQEQVN